MSAPAPPTVPPRPGRAEKAAAQGVSKLPDIPPRPVSKRIERSVSPANYPRSPLNEPWSLTKQKSAEPLPPRQPSVHHLPIPGEEGLEYANTQYQPIERSSSLAQDAAAQTRVVAEDLHLHAPKPSLPSASAAAQVQAVTRADPTAGRGMAKASQEELVTRTRSRGSYTRPDSAASGDRRRSSFDFTEDHGPAEMGMRVPINPYLGDVQAPSPAGLTPQGTGESVRRHGRKKSAMDAYRPPDSYGLHGHGIVPQDKFEREWYAKHPDQLEHEEGQGHGVYEGIGSGRGSFALSSSELNKIVRDTASRGSGFGTAENVNSYPDEQIGYMASEVYQRSQQNTPHPDLSRTQTRVSQPSIESPLRKSSFAADDAPSPEIRRSKASIGGKSDQDSEGEDFHHIEPPKKRYNKVTGGQETMNETEDAKAYISRSDEPNGHEYRVPILAEDEVAKDVGGDYMQAAVSPMFNRRGSGHDEHGTGTLTPGSRPSSRPGSIYNLHSASHSLSRFMSHQDERDHMHTPLEDVAEYEPLFPEAEERASISATERFKRRSDGFRQRFPSQDIWEDTPNSAMYVAEVSTPDLPATAEEKQLGASAVFEPPEKEASRKGEATEEEKRKLESKETYLAKSKFAPHLRDDMITRPGMNQRFPSRDIWEDTPDSNMLTTTVSSPPIDDEGSPVEQKPPVPARPAKSRLGEGASAQQIEPNIVPNIPARPPKRLHAVPPADAKLTDPKTLSQSTSPTELKKVPSIPDRPKPQIPPRPAKKDNDTGLTKVTSGGSADSAETEKAVTSPPLTKTKPVVPPRPAGGNLAGIKGSFMSDLNKKLGLGPPKEKEKEPEAEPEEVKPLEDARKGRARGPQRRAPAKSPGTAPVKPSPLSFSMIAPQSMWQIDDSGSLLTGVEKVKEIMSEEKVAQIDHAAVADTPLPPMIDTTTEAAKEEAQDQDILNTSSQDVTKDTVGDAIVPIPAVSGEDLENNLTRNTTESTSSGTTLFREDVDPNTDAIPASRQTTATDSQRDDDEEKLERVQTDEQPFEKKAEEEPIKLRNEQVNAEAPATGKDSTSVDSNSENSPQDSSTNNKGEEAPKEPMTEADVSYKSLEEMTAQADGKLHSEQEPQTGFTSRKVVD